MSDNVRKTVHVVAAVTCDDLQSPHRIFATARGYGKYKGFWEFPGGKVEPGESPEDALVREIHEELNTAIQVGACIDTIEYDYPEFHLSMKCYWATVVEGNLTLLEAADSRWLDKDTLYTVDWLPADFLLLPKIQSSLSNTHNPNSVENRK